jgi:hypothetical protein
LIGHHIAGPETNLGLVPVTTARGTIYIRALGLTTTGALPPPPASNCIGNYAPPGDNQIGMTNGLGGSCPK